jgi:transcription termination factor Rho
MNEVKMSAGFDRSLLEGKDRDELMQIANALGEKPPSRAKKADIIALVLRAAGVEDDAPTGDDSAPPAKPKRAPRARAAKADAGPPAQLPLEAEASSELPPLAVEGRNGDGPDHDPVPEGDAPVGAGQTAPTGGGQRRGGGRNQGQARGDAGPVQPAGGEQGEPEGDQDQGRSQATVPDQQREDEADRDQGSQDQGSQDQGRNQGNRGRGQGDAGQGNQAETNQAETNQGNQGQGQNQGPNHQSQNQGNQSQNPNQAPPDQAQVNPNHQPDQPQNAHGEGESGNRRRRRRGRDRDRSGGQAQPGQGQGQTQNDDGAFMGDPVPVSGLLDLRDEGYGFLRLKGYLPSKDDVYVSVKQARQHGLRKGDRVTGMSRPAARNEKNPALHSVETVNDTPVAQGRNRPRFEDLTPLFPDERLRLENPEDPTNMTARIIDLLAPIGKGQRGLIVSPPKAGKTTVMKHIARSIETNNPEVHLIVLLVDERPEEVTDMRRWLKRGEVAASTFDRPSEEHTQVAELVIERAKRMVEDGKDVVIILDGITRLARAYNLAQPTSGRIMSGGIDAGALYPPKKFFGAARNVEEGGSLTILATALVETNSRMDEHIFEEFKGTGNMELKLDRRMADRRIFPAIDVDASSTRHEELLFEKRQLQEAWKLRRVLSGLGSEGGSSAAGLELLIDRMRTFKTNDAFLAEIAKAPTTGV